MKLLLDEMHAPIVAVGLRARGHDVVAVKERADMIGLPDRELLLVATAEDRALVTENVKDFAALHKTMTAPAEKHAGIVFTHAEAIPATCTQSHRRAHRCARALPR